MSSRRWASSCRLTPGRRKVPTSQCRGYCILYVTGEPAIKGEEMDRRGWPEERVRKEYGAYEVRQHELSVHRDCVVWGNLVVIPGALQKLVLLLLHTEHPGVSTMKANTK
ncbi:hypothetical protein MRX96_015286 [Rhipicephalus microplus]